MPPPFILAFAIQAVTWAQLTAPAQRLASDLSITRDNFPSLIQSIRERNAARLREGEIDHLIFYLLQSQEFTKERPVDPAAAATSADLAGVIQRRVSDFLNALAAPAGEHQEYFARLVPADAAPFLDVQMARVLGWIRKRETGCRTAPSPQACIAALYLNRGHSSDTSPQSTIPVRAAFDWKRKQGDFDPKRILIVGPGSDFAPRTALRSGPVAVYQPGMIRELAGPGATIDCADLNPRVVRSAAGECDSAIRLDITTESLDGKYDAIIATNVLLYLDQKELLLALHNIRAMLAPGGVFIHNDARFEAQVFGRAAGLPVIHFGPVTVDAMRRPPAVDRFVIHSPAAPKL
jgi:hypothetical protein